MPIQTGARLGPYEIGEPLGAGGMGEVYRARDTRLEREVAIKVLPRRLADHADALARFEREAKAVAALNHPNILALYDFGAHEGRAYAATELLHGETLAERLAAGPLPPRKAADLGRQVARALAAAHDRGIVHRDLKPANIFVTSEGRAKVLDFGLVGTRDGDEGAAGSQDAPTRTSLTEPGTLMGTVGYMSPEQARGHAADHRSDIFAFGSVLYEMLTGHRPFERETAAETLTAILREDPPEFPESASGVSTALERVVRRCLEKQPAERFQSARDLAFAVDNAAGGTSAPTERRRWAGAAAPARSGVPRLLLAAALLGAGLAAGYFLRGAAIRPDSPADPVRLRAITVSGRDGRPSASPDGRMIAFVSDRDGRSRIWIKQLRGGGEEPLTRGPDTAPRFSPDGASVLFLRNEAEVMSVYRQALVGGQERKLVHNATEADWSPDGRDVVFVRSRYSEGRRVGQLGIAGAQSGDERILFESDRGLYGARWRLDGSQIVVTEASVTGNVPDNRLVMVDAATGAAERVVPGETRSAISLSAWNGIGNQLVFARAGSLIGDQGDPVSRVVLYDLDAGRERLLFYASHLFPLQGLRIDYTRFDIVGPGTLVFDQTQIRQYLMEFGGSVAGGRRTLTRGYGRDRQPAYSPDGERVIFTSNRSGNLDLWICDRASGAMHQVTDDAAQDWDPAWSPDGQRILWSSDRETGHMEIWMANADGSGARQVTRDGVDAENATMTPDGEWIVYVSANPSKVGVWKVRPDGAEPTLLSDGNFLQPEVSPDGRWASYVSIQLDELQNEIRFVDVETGEVQPHPIVVPLQLQSGGIIYGRSRWMPSGAILAFVGMDEDGLSGIFLQEFVPGQATPETRRKLAGFSREFITESFAVSPDGQRVMIAGLEPSYRILLAENVPGIVPR
jgi:Tol biopolymer transport system component